MAARLAGRLLAGVFAIIMLVRRPRPIHPRGIMLEGDITRLALRPASGISWVDDDAAPPLAVLARLSRSIGLPSILPDVIGLALRFEHDGRPVDIELASTGVGVPSRFMLRPHRFASRARLGTLLPYGSQRGPLLLCARTLSPRDLPAEVSAVSHALRHTPWRLRFYYATPKGRWHPFADLTLSRPIDHALPDLRFDAVRHLLPGASTYEWVRAVRQPSYLLAQR